MLNCSLSWAGPISNSNISSTLFRPIIFLNLIQSGARNFVNMSTKDFWLFFAKAVLAFEWTRFLIEAKFWNCVNHNRLPRFPMTINCHAHVENKSNKWLHQVKHDNGSRHIRVANNKFSFFLTFFLKFTVFLLNYSFLNLFHAS